MSDLNDKLTLAKEKQKITMLYIDTDWCTRCRDIERNIFVMPDVAKALENITLLRLDVTENNEEHKNAYHKLNIFPAPPIILLFNPNKENDLLNKKHSVNHTNISLIDKAPHQFIEEVKKIKQVMLKNKTHSMNHD